MVKVDSQMISIKSRGIIAFRSFQKIARAWSRVGAAAKYLLGTSSVPINALFTSFLLEFSDFPDLRPQGSKLNR